MAGPLPFRLSAQRLRDLRFGAQLLHRPTRASPVELVRRLCGVQAQVISAAGLALRARTTGLTASLVDEARTRDRSIVRIWAMRGTLHLIAADDFGWVSGLLAPRTLRRSTGRMAELGIAGDPAERAVRAVERMLEREGALTRAEIAAGLARRGLPWKGQAAYHVVRLAALHGVVCLGPDRGGEPGFVLVRDWLESRLATPSEAALGELAVRYLAGYGPAEPRDLAAWSGLTLAEARAGWRSVADRLAEVTVDGRRAWRLRSGGSREPPASWRAGRRVVGLIPSFDPYVVGYAVRDFAVPRQHARKVVPGGGWLHPVVLADGLAVGTWSVEPGRARLVVRVAPFGRLASSARQALVAEARDVARFQGAEGELVVARPLGS